VFEKIEKIVVLVKARFPLSENISRE